MHDIAIKLVTVVAPFLVLMYCFYLANKWRRSRVALTIIDFWHQDGDEIFVEGNLSKEQVLKMVGAWLETDMPSDFKEYYKYTVHKGRLVYVLEES